MNSKKYYLFLLIFLHIFGCTSKKQKIKKNFNSEKEIIEIFPEKGVDGFSLKVQFFHGNNLKSKINSKIKIIDDRFILSFPKKSMFHWFELRAKKDGTGSIFDNKNLKFAFLSKLKFAKLIGHQFHPQKISSQLDDFSNSKGAITSRYSFTVFERKKRGKLFLNITYKENSSKIPDSVLQFIC